MRISLRSGIIVNALRIVAGGAYGRVVEYLVFRFTENGVRRGLRP